MKIVVIGPGALGCFLATSILVRATPDQHTSLWLLDHSPERAARLGDTGLRLEEAGRIDHCPVQATADPEEIGAADLLFLCVKSGAVAASLEHLAPLLSPTSLLISLQNGIGHLDHLFPWTRPGCAALGVTAQGANLVDSGHVRHAGSGATSIGFPEPAATEENARLARTADLLNRAGWKTETVPDIISLVWDKLMVNTGINALTAIHNCANGELLTIPTARGEMRAAVAEAAAVARAKGISLSSDPIARTEEVCRATATNISSMLQDVRRKRPTEIGAINGAVVAVAEELGLAVPVNRGLTRRVKELESNYLF